MANNCFVNIEITACTENDAGRLHEILTAAKKAADEKQAGVYIGCDSRYLFDAKFDLRGERLGIFGWVKWGFSDIEVWKFLAWLMARTAIKDFRMRYDECGALLYGEYHYDMHMLTDRRLPQEHYPVDGDAADAEKAFEQFDVIRYIG